MPLKGVQSSFSRIGKTGGFTSLASSLTPGFFGVGSSYFGKSVDATFSISLWCSGRASISVSGILAISAAGLIL